MRKKSFFDRLITEDHSTLGEGTLDDLIYQITNHLDELFNSHQGGALIGHMYGLPDFNDLFHSRAEESNLTKITGDIQKVIEKYEPRLRVNKVTKAPSEKDKLNQLVFSIVGEVSFEGRTHAIQYHTIMTGSGRILVER